MAYPYTISEEESVKEYIEENKKHYPRLDHVWEGLKWNLRRIPHEGEKQEDDRYLSIKSPNWDDKEVPIITVLYSFDGYKVTIHNILIEPGDQ